MITLLLISIAAILVLVILIGTRSDSDKRWLLSRIETLESLNRDLEQSIKAQHEEFKRIIDDPNYSRETDLGSLFRYGGVPKEHYQLAQALTASTVWGRWILADALEPVRYNTYNDAIQRGIIDPTIPTLPTEKGSAKAEPSTTNTDSHKRL